GMDGAARPPAAGASVPSVAAPQTPAAEPEPWHDPALPIAERLKLAEGQAPPRRLMAAMAQLDCGACGYVCRTYADAIASGNETRLTLCSPGGSETSRALKRLLKDQAPPASGNTTHANGVAKSGVSENRNGQVAPGVWTRVNPYPARVLRS